MTVQEAHKEYNSLIDQIWAKYKLLDSGECGQLVSQHLMLNPVNLLAHMSKLCQHLNLPMPKELHRPCNLSIEGTFWIKITYSSRFS